MATNKSKSQPPATVLQGNAIDGLAKGMTNSQNMVTLRFSFPASTQAQPR